MSKQSLKSVARTAQRIAEMTGANEELEKIIEHMISSVVANRDRVIEYQKKKIKPRHVVIDEQRVSGAIRECIKAHGPITPEFIGSASKRICGQLLQIIKE